MITKKSVINHIEHLQKYAEWTIEQIAENCKENLKELREFPEDNKHQIRYYEKVWMELSTY